MVFQILLISEWRFSTKQYPCLWLGALSSSLYGIPVVDCKDRWIFRGISHCTKVSWDGQCMGHLHVRRTVDIPLNVTLSQGIVGWDGHHAIRGSGGYPMEFPMGWTF